MNLSKLKYILLFFGLLITQSCSAMLNIIEIAEIAVAIPDAPSCEECDDPGISYRIPPR